MACGCNGLRCVVDAVHCKAVKVSATRREEALATVNKQLLVVSAIGPNRAETLHGMARVVRDCGCNIAESRVILLGTEIGMLFLVTGSWNTIARFESAIPRLEQQYDLKIVTQRTAERPARNDLIPYAVDVVCIDQPGIVYSLADFFAARDIGIAELTTRTYQAAHTGAPMFSLQMAINVPADLHIASLREDFLDFCDQMNLDAILEPIKN